jgi:hypothetical protein
MGFRDPVTQRIGRWVCLPFGASQSPSIFCQVTQAAAGVFNHLFAEFGVQAHTICYVDDYFVVACDHFHLRAAFRVMDMEASLLGLEFKGPKDVGLAQPLRQLEFLGVLVRADVGDLCLPPGKRLAYAEFLSSFHRSHALASHVSRQLLEPLLGRLGFAASTFRWGYLLLQNMFAALYGEPGNGLPASCPLSVEFWDEFRYWDAVLTSPVVPFGGVTRSFARDTTLPFQHLTFDHHIFTDASTSYGWGAVLRDQVVFGPWPDLSRVDHICWLELTAIRLALFRFRFSLAGSRVLVHTDSAVALGY